MSTGYKPLAIDEAAEQRYMEQGSRLKAALRRFARPIPLLNYYLLPEGRTSIEEQLQERSHFPTGEWEASEISAALALEVSTEIQLEMYLPCPHFLPEDPVPLLLIPDGDDFAWQHVFLALHRRFGVEYSEDQMLAIKEERWELSRLVRDLAEKAPADTA